VFCTAGDLLRVPAGTKHWFDMGSAPLFCAIRLFTTPDGWQASFTGDAISERVPTYDALART
jgi:1,2-dihydroxy-3-keto-5-methylthiopentene dioxygenase